MKLVLKSNLTCTHLKKFLLVKSSQSLTHFSLEETKVEPFYTDKERFEIDLNCDRASAFHS
jgi:hypothetical protein